MAIRIEVTRDKKLWNEIVNKSCQGSIFHTWEWLKIAEKHTGFRFYPIVGYIGDEKIGIFPLFYKRRYGIRMVFSPPPYSAISYLGPALLNYVNLKEDKRLYYLSEFQKEVDMFIHSELNANYILINLSPKLIDCRPFKWTNYQIKPIFHYLLDLSKGADYVWMQFKKALRENVKKAKKKGVYFEEGGKEELLSIYKSLIERYREQKRTVNISKNYLLDIYNKFYPNNLKIFTARHDGKILTGIVALCFKDTISFWIGGTRASGKESSLYPNDFLHWEGIKWACEHGYRYYEEFGAGTERLARFKSKYNPTLVICFSVKKYSNFLVKLAEFTYRKIRIKI